MHFKFSVGYNDGVSRGVSQLEAEIKVELDRIHDEDARQNHRLNDLEQTVKELNDLVLNIQRLTLSVESLTKEVQRQGQRLESIEKAPLDRISSAKQTALNTIIGIVIGALAVGIVQLIAQNM